MQIFTSFIIQVLRIQIENSKVTKNFYGQSQSKL